MGISAMVNQGFLNGQPGALTMGDNQSLGNLLISHGTSPWVNTFCISERF